MKVPPYSKPLHEALLNGQRPTSELYLYIGNNAWDKGRNSVVMRPSRTLVLPPNESPTNYFWPVHGCNIIMIETSRLSTEYIELIAQILLDYGSGRIMLISHNLLTTIYEKDF
jgi:hypothetical protein